VAARSAGDQLNLALRAPVTPRLRALEDALLVAGQEARGASTGLAVRPQHEATGADGYRERLARIYAHLRAHAPRARVVALPQPDWSMSPAAVEFGDVAAIAREIERFNEIARAEGERSGARWIDLFPLMREQARRGMFAADGLHPSASAYAEWARELARAWAW